MSEFTVKMTENLPANWRDFCAPLFGQDVPLSYLEIGTFEGGSACWMLDNVLTHPDSRCCCVDSWQDYGRHKGSVIEQRARQNLSRHGDKVSIHKGDSKAVLQGWRKRHDIIYIDGDHSCAGCLADSNLCWPLLKVGGVLIWDDYGMVCSIQTKLAIRRFLRRRRDYEFVFDRDHQYGVRKVCDKSRSRTGT